VNPDPGPGEAGEEKKYSRKLFSSLFDKKLHFNYVCPSYRRSLQTHKEITQHSKKLNLLTFFSVCGTLLPS
jgi:hypothetical protein